MDGDAVVDQEDGEDEDERHLCMGWAGCMRFGRRAGDRWEIVGSWLGAGWEIVGSSLGARWEGRHDVIEEHLEDEDVEDEESERL